jgi:iron complex transport system ATP-binding protein
LTPVYQVADASVRYGSAEVLRSASLSLHPGEFAAIAGPNGAGKSTLLNLLAGLSAPSSGTCDFMGSGAHKWPRRDFAKRVAVVQQAETAAFPFTAEEVVCMGRTPHQAGMYESAEDHAAVAEALKATGMTDFAKREYRTLSGGEKQRILLASALAQAPEVLLLDEPAAHLDLRHQVELHHMLRDLSRRGILVVSVTHDRTLAAAYATRLILLHKGRIRADGPPGAILTPDLLEEVFEVRVEIHRRASGQPWVLYGE